MVSPSDQGALAHVKSAKLSKDSIPSGKFDEMKHWIFFTLAKNCPDKVKTNDIHIMSMGEEVV